MDYAVLFVDDEPAVLDGLRKALRKAPFQIYTAPSGRLALELMSEQDIAVVVSDERMPEMSGADFLARVRRAHPATELIMLTGHASLEAAIVAINEGRVARFLTKPIDSAQLQAVILAVLAAAHPEDLELHPTRRQRMLEGLEARHHGITQVDRDEHGRILLDG